MLNNMNSGWREYRKEEEFLDNLQRFNKKLEREKIIGDDRIILLNVYTSDLVKEYKLKAI